MKTNMIYDDSLERWAKYVNVVDFVFRAYGKKKISQKEFCEQLSDLRIIYRIGNPRISLEIL